MDDDTTSSTEIEQVYETWRMGITAPTITEAMSASTFEEFTKSTFVAGWVARGRIPANTGSRR